MTEHECTDWIRIEPIHALRGFVKVPGDKSISHRALLLNAIANGIAVVRNLSTGTDVSSTMQCLRALGLRIDVHTADDNSIAIYGAGPAGLTKPTEVLNAGNSGSTLRMLTGLLSHRPFKSVISGDVSLNKRPVARVIEPLRAMGANIFGTHHDSYPPVTINGRPLVGTEHKLPISSAQVKTAILLAALESTGTTKISEPFRSRDHTERMLANMGATISSKDTNVSIQPGPLSSIDLEVPGDISSAAFWIVAAVCHPNAEIHLPNIGINPTRIGVLEVLWKMGADIVLRNERQVGGEPVADLVARTSRLTATNISRDLVVRSIDELPILALAACFAQGTTRIDDAQELRVKETDRIHSTVKELTSLGGSLEENSNGLIIHGPNPIRGGSVSSHGDHRMALTLAIAACLGQESTLIENSSVVDISYPEFWETLSSISNQESLS